MGVHRTCGEPDEIKKNTHPKNVNVTTFFRGQGAGAALLGKWVPTLLRGLQHVPTGPGSSPLAYNDPNNPIVGRCTPLARATATRQEF